MSDFLQKELVYIKGVGPKRAELLQKELGLTTVRDLLYFTPFRYEDRSSFIPIGKVDPSLKEVQVKAKVKTVREMGQARKRRLSVVVFDDTGYLELVWFKGVNFWRTKLKVGQEYIFYGKPSKFGSRINISHPEVIDAKEKQEAGNSSMEPVYHSTQAMKKANLESKQLRKIYTAVFEDPSLNIEENLPNWLLQAEGLAPRSEALRIIHFPKHLEQMEEALRRLKQEELFFMQLKLLRIRGLHAVNNPGFVFKHFQRTKQFVAEVLPFTFTKAQNRVLGEIKKDLQSGQQMNRLLQGDVGSGKTVVAFVSILMALDNGCQACLMAPTELLAQQHFKSLIPFVESLGLDMRLLTGSTKQSVRNEILPLLEGGNLPIIVGTHALLEDKVRFNRLGLVVIDEQHRFGVAQRARLWEKNPQGPRPHVLVMTATPIPRTLSMTMYGDLHVSVIDELPKGRKPVRTVHRYEKSRKDVYDFVKGEIAKGRQAYFVYPLIEESETLPYKDVEQGLKVAREYFPLENYSIVVVTGAMTPSEKEANMLAFAQGKAQIMIATTVIEVGINVPNASIMVIESAEKFGLSQLHQLRGRVGRGSEQSYCILMTDYQISATGRTRLETMVRTNDGFEIAEVDLRLRGPGDMMGTQQSGKLEMHFADLAKDGQLVEKAREAATKVLTDDFALAKEENKLMKKELTFYNHIAHEWSEIS